MSIGGSGGNATIGGGLALGGHTNAGGSNTDSSGPQNSGGKAGGQASTVAASGGETSATGGAGNAPGAEVTRYDYTFDLHTGEAASHLTITAQSDADGCANLASALELKEIAASPGYAVRPDTGHIAMCGSFRAGQPLALSTKQTVQRQFDANTGVGFSQRVDESKSTFSYLLGWFEQCARFGPCDPSPASLSHFTFTVTHDANDVVLCPGVRRTDGTSTICELLGTPAPTYSSFGIAAHTAWIARPLVEAGGVSVETYDTPRSALSTTLDASAVGEYLNWLTALLGPYPYGNHLRIAAAPVTWLGMEHPGNIIVREDVATLFTGYENTPLHVALHEIAHQWAGDRTTPESALDFLWKEAIAEYLSYVFEEQFRSRAEATATRRLWHGLGLGSPFAIRPRKTPPVSLEDWTASGYGSAPLALFVQLEPWLGRPVLLAAIQRFLVDSGARSMKMLQVALESESHLDLERYFEAWVWGDAAVEWPELAATLAPSDSGVTIAVTQIHPEQRIFPCVVDVDLTTASRTLRVQVDFGLAPVAASVSTTLALDEPVVSLRIDPDRRLLAWPQGLSASALATSSRILFHP